MFMIKGRPIRDAIGDCVGEFFHPFRVDLGRILKVDNESGVPGDVVVPRIVIPRLDAQLEDRGPPGWQAGASP